MITLKHALKITNNARWNDRYVKLYNICPYAEWHSMYTVLTKYDLKKVMVYKIKPEFDFYGNYNGMGYYCKIDKENR